MKSYALSDAFYASLKRNMFLFIARPVMIVAPVVIGICAVIGDISLAVAPLCVVLVVAAFSGWNGYRHWRKVYLSFRLILDEDAITCVQKGSPDVRIDRQEISRIQERAGQGLCIEVVNSKVQMGVPSTLNDFVEVRERLSSWSPIEPVSSSRM